MESALCPVLVGWESIGLLPLVFVSCVPSLVSFFPVRFVDLLYLSCFLSVSPHRSSLAMFLRTVTVDSTQQVFVQSHLVEGVGDFGPFGDAVAVVHDLFHLLVVGLVIVQGFGGHSVVPPCTRHGSVHVSSVLGAPPAHRRSILPLRSSFFRSTSRVLASFVSHAPVPCRVVRTGGGSSGGGCAHKRR